MESLAPTVNASLSSFCNSTFWDTNLTWNSPDPDFTACFEKTFLVWFPCAYLWIFSTFEISSLRRGNPTVRFNSFQILKLNVIGFLILTSMFDVAVYIFAPERLPPVNIYTPVIKFLTLSLFFGLTYTNVKCGVRSSGMLFMFSLFLALSGAPQFRTVNRSFYTWTVDNGTNSELAELISYLIYYPLVLMVLFLNCFADVPPATQSGSVDELNVCPEYKSSFLSRIFFVWFDKFAWKGYRRPLGDGDLWELDHEMRAVQIVEKFESKWHQDSRPGRDEAPSAETASIVRPLVKVFGPYFMIGFIFRLLFGILNIVNPEILNLILIFVGDSKEFSWHGYLYVFLLLIIAILQVLFFNYSYHEMTRVGLQMRTALVSVIYKKALKISNKTKKDFSLGEIVNLMAVNAQNFIPLMVNIIFVIVATIEISVAIYLLWNILGLCVLVGVSTLVVFMIFNGVIISKIETLQMKQMEFKDKRIKLTNEILSGIKVLKLYACEPSYEKRLIEIRKEENAVLRKTVYLRAGSSFTWICTPVIVPFVTFGAYVLSSKDHVLDPKKAFVSLSLFNVIKYCMGMLPSAFTNFVQVNVAIKRINRFLNSEELDPDAVSHEPRAEPIVITNGNFSWNDHVEPPILKSINVEVNSGTLVAVVGPVGSGKSSLLSAILGEMYRRSGVVNTTGTLAYVPQQAWLRNATLKNNITFGEPGRSSFYNSILEACALIPDLKILPNGDHTEIGEKGINLSGGQKQRVSLARAVYSGADTYLLDDPLSAVDAHVGKHIFERVIGPKGLLKDKTRIFVTHNLAYLPQVDFIIVLEDGMISEQGTYNDLLKKESHFADFLSSYLKDGEGGSNDQENLQPSHSTIDEKLRSSDPDGDEKLSERRRSSSESAQSEIRTGVTHTLIEKESSETGNVKWSVILYYLQAMSPFLVFVTVLFNVSCQIFSISSDYWLSAWSNSAVTNRRIQYVYLSGYALFGLGQAVSVITQTIALYVGLLKAATYVHNRLLSSVLHWPLTTFDKIPSGRILNRFGFDLDVLDNTLPANVLESLAFVAIVTSSLFVISFNTPLFLGVLVPLIAIYWIIQRVFSATSRQLKRLESVSKSPIYSHFGDTITGAQSIRAYDLQTKFIEESNIKIDTNQKSSYLAWIARRWLSIRLELLGATIVFSAALFAVLAKNTISTALVGLSVTYAFQVTRNLFLWIRKSCEVETNIVAIERIKEYSEVEHEAAWILPTDDEQVPRNWPKNGEIIFQNFQVRYQENLEPVLRGVSFEVKAGEKVGIVGRTGAGKSSLTLSLFRIIESAGGSILIDDIDISKIGLHTLRSRLTIIPQDPSLFSGTLRMNLDPAGQYSDSSIWKALEMVNLKAYVSSLFSGLMYEINEGGSNFSVGQRQLLCLARALLRKTKVLILDEATAAVDFETDDAIQATIRKEFIDSTVLTIAHRLNTVLDYDRIVVLDNGRVAEFDSPSVLMESKESIFYRMAVDAGLA